MRLPLHLAVFADLIVGLLLGFTPIFLAVLSETRLSWISKILSTKIISFITTCLICFYLRQVFIGIQKIRWAWMIGYQLFGLFILLYMRKKKGYSDVITFRLAVYSIWTVVFLKESLFYLIYGWEWFIAIMKVMIHNTGEWWMYLGFHVSCIISTICFFSLLVRLYWRPSVRWIILLSLCILFELFIVVPLIASLAGTFSLGEEIAIGAHRFPWFILVLLAVIETPVAKDRG